MTKNRVVPIAGIALFVFLSPQTTYAGFFDGIAISGITTGLAWIFNLLFSIIQVLIVGLISIFNYLVFIRVDNGLPVIKATWTILRDFSNLFFIVILIWMAFATIFQLSGTKFSDLIFRFIIVAVLINFSLAIGGLIIDAVQVVTNVFLSTIGNPADKIGQYLNPSDLFLKTPDSAFTAGDEILGVLISTVFQVILSLMFLFSILVADAFAFLRIIFIWGLLLVSPLAWMSLIFPATRGWWTKWWNYFLGWNLFLPVYLFFLYIGLVFLSQRNSVIGAVTQNVNYGDPTIYVGANSYTFNLLFFYVFAVVIIGGGAWAAQAVVSSFGYTGFQWGYSKARGWMGKATGYDVRRDAIKGAAGARIAEFQQKGFQNKFLNKIYGGKEGDDRLKSRYASMAGVKDAKDKQLSTDIGNWKTRYNTQDTRALQSIKDDDKRYTEYQRLAAMEILKDRNQLSNSELVEAYNLYGKQSEQSALKFATTLDYGKMSSVEREAWFNRTNNLELKKKIAGVRADRGDYDDVDDIREMSTLFTSETERANFIKRAAKRLPNSDIRTLLAGATGRQERTAISELLADKQDLTGAEILSVYRELGEGSEEGEKFLGKIKFDGLNRTDRDDLYTASDDFADVSTKFKLFEAIVDKGEFDSARLNSMVSTYRTADEKKNLISKAQKKDFVTASQARVAAGFNPNFAAAVTEQLNRMKPDDLADLPAGTKGWGDGTIKAALRARIADLNISQPPTGPVLTNPAMRPGPGNPWIPGKPGGGDKLKQDVLAAIKGDRSKIADVISL